MVTLHVPGWPSSERWTPVATCLATLALPEALPEIDERAVVSPQTTETAMCGLPWKVASDSSHKLAGRLRWLLVTGLRVLDCEVVALE